MTDTKKAETFDVVVVGGGPAGATAAFDLALEGRNVVLLDRDDRVKPCGGAIPPVAMREFGIPESALCTRVTSARMIGPSGKIVIMPVENGFVGMVDRKTFDPWLRERAEKMGAKYIRGTFKTFERDADGTAVVTYLPKDAKEGAEPLRLRARAVIGADGSSSRVARQTLGEEKIPQVGAYHEIVKTPEGFDGTQCDVWYQGRVSPDFYGWVFPHGDTVSIGVGSDQQGFNLKDATKLLRELSGLTEAETLRCEGAPLPLYPRKKWDNGRDLVLAGDAAGCVAPSSGEGIFYAMEGGRLAARAVSEFLMSGRPEALANARVVFMERHGKVFRVLGWLQKFWYRSDKRREQFVTLCADKDIQAMTWDSYMNKRMTRKKSMAKLKVFFKDLAHLVGLMKTDAEKDAKGSKKKKAA
ncbi:geranylgeranyl diphosphate reductase [Phaeovibrio sulfidiphilus]|uniref:geranylgeranyl diphosphate reductase n=1 Tax=Phaeovibrio sulfidiphilus TaxID=1220600 RepID=A0A8J6YL42_9PROT|nr:geranylgeranyl diphosphate reductase [Phaeovibrio sulfidiphilus]MBE1236320.1 geranylgeranyl diphosphate reductase [Phaeovibrio sulfidiphilus]